jgi:hypothetical protein
MATPLPEKIWITGKNHIDPENFKGGVDTTQDELSPDDLSTTGGQDSPRAKYDAYYAEKARRKDPSQPGVAQEALDLLDELKADDRSSAELWEVYGYSPRHVAKKAQKEEKRLIAELRSKAFGDVQESAEVALKKADVKAKHGIPDWVPAPDPPGPPETPATGNGKNKGEVG